MKAGKGDLNSRIKNMNKKLFFAVFTASVLNIYASHAYMQAMLSDYFFDDRGRIVKGVGFSGNTQIIKYDENNKPVSAIWYNTNGDQIYTDTFTHNEDGTFVRHQKDMNGVLVSEFYYKSNSALWGPGTAYDHVDEYTNGQPKQTIVYSTNSNGNIDHYYRYYPDGSYTGGHDDFYWTYDAQGNPISGYRGGNRSEVYTFAYDANGNLTGVWENGRPLGSVTHGYKYSDEERTALGVTASAGNHAAKRIYTVEEAEKLSKTTGNTIKLRYK